MLHAAALPFILLANSLLAGSSDPSGYYQGTIGNRHAITMMLDGSQKGGTLVGSYRYAGHSSNLELKQIKAEADKLALDESDENGKITGRFDGKIDAKGDFTGQWTSADGKRNLSFQLHRFAEVVGYSVKEPKFEVARSTVQFTAKTPFCKALNEQLVKSAKKDLASCAAFFRKETQDPNASGQLFVSTTSVKVLYADPSLVSLLYNEYQDTGGVHGNTNYVAVTYAWRNGQLVELHNRDLISLNYPTLITKLLQKDLKHQKASEADEVRKMKLADLVMNPTDCGLMVSFSPYAVGCYAEGSFQVLLPYSSIKPAIPADSPLTQLAEE